MNDNQFDDIIKNRLEQFASKIPEDMWDRIEHKNKKRRIFFVRWRYFFILVVMIGALTTGYFLLNKNVVLTKNNLVTKNENSKSDKENSTASLQKGSVNDSSINTGPINSIQQKTLKQRTTRFTDNPSKIDLQGITMPEVKQATAENKEQNKNEDSEGNHKPELPPGKKEYPAQNEFSLDAEPEGEDEKQDVDEPERFAIEFYGSPDLSFGKFSSSYSHYEQFRNSSTNFRLSYTFGTRLDMFITRHIVARSGLQYSVTNEKFSATDSVFGFKTSNNHYKSFDIPLLLGYYTANKNFAAMFNAGIVLNLKSSYEGYLPDPDGSIVNLGSTKMYKTNTGVSLYFGASFSKQLNAKTDLFAEPYLKYRLSNMAAGFQPFTQKINTAGISLGMRHRFFKNTE